MHVRGTCLVQIAFDVGFEIDLGQAAERLAPASRGEVFRHKRGPEDAPAERWPLRSAHTIEPLELGAGRTAERLEVALYRFGALSLTYALPVEGELERLVATSAALYDDRRLLGHARERAQGLLELLGDAVREPRLAETVEDYVLYRLEPPPGGAAALLESEPELLARVLRAEPGALSTQEVENALSGRIAYGPDELVLVDWFAAVLFGTEMEDERRTLELATVELCELRFLEGRLELRIDEAYGLLGRGRRTLQDLRPKTLELARLARFQADSAVLHENLDNALKLLGDDYLARLYAIASARFHFAAWDASIERKLGTLERIYGKLSDRSAQRRAELLEWIIILLFVLDIALVLAHWGD